MLGWPRPVSFINGRIVAVEGLAGSLRCSSRVLELDEPPRPGDEVVDLEGAFLLPGLINAHDHLELNHYGPLKSRVRYDNATAWIDDLRPALRDDATIRAKSSFPLCDRLFIGGLKNLLAGVTTVAHHNPLYRELDGRVPIRVLERFAWAHSFALEGRPVGAHGETGARVRDQARRTPRRVPFIVHAGEGVDQAAADEVTRLEHLGCLRSNTVLVHGVAITPEAWMRVLAKGTSLVWCPASNVFLFGRTIPAREFLDALPHAWCHVCLGTDSRVTGARDLLDELRVARAAAQVTAEELLRMVTGAAALVLKLRDAGRLALGSPADFIVVPPTHDAAADALLAARRGDLALVAVGGRPLVGQQRFAGVFKARRVGMHPIRVDGEPRMASAGLARDLARCPIHEPGVVAGS